MEYGLCMLFMMLHCFLGFSCVDRKSSDLGLGGMRREYLQTDCAINAVILFLLCWLVHDNLI